MLAGQQSTGIDSHLKAAEEMEASLQEWPSRALPVMTECRSLLELASPTIYNQGPQYTIKVVRLYAVKKNPKNQMLCTRGKFVFGTWMS